MRRFSLIFLFVVSLLMFAVVTMPLGFLLGKSGARQAGFTWQAAQGGIFNGKISGARFGAQPIGDVELAFTPSSLLRAKLGYKFQWGGPTGTGAGHIALNRSDLTISDLDADFQLAEFVYLIADIRNTNGKASIQNGVVSMNEGSCNQASGSVISDIVTKVAARYDTQASQLSGALSCDTDALQLAMEGSIAQEGKLTTKLRLDLLGASNFEANVDTRDPLLIAGLSSYGFQEGPNGVVFRDELTLSKGF